MGPPQPMLEFAARRCFWDLGLTALSKLAAMEGVPVASPPTLFSTASVLVQQLLNPSPTELDDILSLRSNNKSFLVSTDVPMDVVADVSGESEEKSGQWPGVVTETSVQVLF
eukprot:4998859-Lingulodinium_polyedra.AAC.1